MKASVRRSLGLAPHQFNLSNHQPTGTSSRTKKLMKSIIRLAKLMRVVAPLGPVSLRVNSRDELEVLIRNFLYLVNERYFPIFGYQGEEWMHEQIDEQMDEWMGGWTVRDYHPLLTQIPVYPQGYSDHDIEPENYGDLVALLYWLGTIDEEIPEFEANFQPRSIWSMDERANSRLAQTAEILAGMTLETPLNHLSGLIKTILHQTETFFLDACPLCGGFSGPDFDWTVENFIYFRDDWKRAKPIYDGNQELIEWSRNSSMRLTEISIILKKAHSFYKDDKCPEWCE